MAKTYITKNFCNNLNKNLYDMLKKFLNIVICIMILIEK